MTSIVARIALPIISAGILGGTALGLAGMASAQTTTVENSTGTAIVATPDTHAKPAPTAKPGWHNHKGMGHSYLFTQ
jgi:hypothetical protein